MAHLGMELGGEEAATRVFHNGDGAILGFSSDHEAFGGLHHRVAMAHPDGLHLIGSAIEQRRAAQTQKLSGAVLPHLGVAHLAAQLGGHDLVAVAEAQNGDVQVEDAGVHVGCVLCID